jgi:hypothetical protein
MVWVANSLVAGKAAHIMVLVRAHGIPKFKPSPQSFAHQSRDSPRVFLESRLLYKVDFGLLLNEGSGKSRPVLVLQ